MAEDMGGNYPKEFYQDEFSGRPSDKKNDGDTGSGTTRNLDSVSAVDENGNPIEVEALPLDEESPKNIQIDDDETKNNELNQANSDSVSHFSVLTVGEGQGGGESENDGFNNNEEEIDKEEYSKWAEWLIPGKLDEYKGIKSRDIKALIRAVARVPDPLFV